MKLPTSILCTKDEGFFPVSPFPPCPEERKYADWVGDIVPVLGIGLGVLLPLVRAGIPLRNTRRMEYLRLGCGIPIVASVVVFFLYLIYDARLAS